MFFSHDWYHKFGKKLEHQGRADHYERKYLSNGEKKFATYKDFKPKPINLQPPSKSKARGQWRPKTKMVFI